VNGEQRGEETDRIQLRRFENKYANIPEATET
jgi:hypothetical protein